ncbi:MAG: YebC/PmpR family DNA-binding transcriptional regulator [Patescibacteria group bacterium]
MEGYNKLVMSGHSKWATIKRQKGTMDIKRGLTFTKLSNAIYLAVKKGGGDTNVNSNFRLRLAVDFAKSENMPKETIERAINRAAGKGENVVEEVIYEGFSAEGVSVIVEAATDNLKRTTSEIKSFFNKEGATFGQPGAVSYQFRQVTSIEVSKDSKTIEEIFEHVVEAGAEDIEDIDEKVMVYANSQDAGKVKDKLIEKGFKVLGITLIRKPIVLMPIFDKEKLDKTINFLHKLEELDDVQKIYSNLDVQQ